jgi:hypothetical protein
MGLRRLRRAEAELHTFVRENSFSPDDEHFIGQPSAIDRERSSCIQRRADTSICSLTDRRTLPHGRGSDRRRARQGL